MTKLGDIFKGLGALRDKLRSPKRHEASASQVEVANKPVRVRNEPLTSARATEPRQGTTSDSSADSRRAPSPNAVGQREVASRSASGSDWADLQRLRISAADAFSLNVSLDRADDSNEGALATIGLDFGTAFTKAVVRFGGRDYAVEWDKIVRLEGRDKYLLPTCFSEHGSGSLLLGAKTAGGWTTHSGIKMRLLRAGPDSPDPVAVGNAVLFLALAVRHVQAWTRDHVPGAKRSAIRWRLHIALPSVIFKDPRASLFSHVGSVAYTLASQQGPLRRDDISRFAYPSTVQQVSVRSELGAQLSAYHASKRRQDDLHVLVDIGAATLDIAFFVDFRSPEAHDVIQMMGCRVKRLGTHFLLAALVGSSGEGREWVDGDSQLDDFEIGKRLGESTERIAVRRREYCKFFERAFEEAYLETYSRYQSGPVNLRERQIPVLLCGGGSRIAAIQEIVRPGLHDQFVHLGRVAGFAISPLPAPAGENFVYEGGQYDRMAIAHGLCELNRNAAIVYPEAPEAVELGKRTADKDRDDDR